MKNSVGAKFFTPICISLFSLLSPHVSLGQLCTTSAQITTDVNITAVTWTSDGVGGLTAATCAAIMAGTNTTTSANFKADVANGIMVSFTNSVTVNGYFDIPMGPTGDASILKISGGGTPITLHVTGSMGDASNNNIQYDVVAATDHLQVDGTLYGKNNNQFIGNGSITGGTLNVKNGTSCGSPCPVSGGFSTCVAGDAFCTTYTVLPILLSSFSFTATDQVVKLNWSTSSEINFDHFVLEKSTNGTHFSELAQVKGSGTSNTRHNYSYTDFNPFIGSSYYRLTSIDFDGYAEIFDKNVIRADVKAEKNFNISPNPISRLTLKAAVNFDAVGSIIIYDQEGSQIATYSVINSEFDLQLPQLSNGFYFAQLQSSGFSKTVRFAVLY